MNGVNRIGVKGCQKCIATTKIQYTYTIIYIHVCVYLL